MKETKNKTIAITGSTGGLGKEICLRLVSWGNRLILLDRNLKKSEEHKKELLDLYPKADIKCIQCDLENIESVKKATESLLEYDIDVFLHNAGAYYIPRYKCSTGYDNIYQINFASPYYITKKLLPKLKVRNGKVVAVGSIAHNYSKINDKDIDFSTVKACSKAYGNAKRYLMFALWELFKNENDVKLSIVHPGITVTNITAHYPDWVYAIIKYPIKLIFMKPKKGVLSIIEGIHDECKYLEWIGPKYFDVWGNPKKRFVNTSSESERIRISQIAEEVYKKLLNS